MEPTKCYPNIRQAIILLVFLFLLGTGVGIIVFVAGLPLGDPAGQAIVSVVGTAIILLWGIRRTRVSFRELCPFSSFRVIILVPLVLVIVGLGIILSEVDNVTRSFLPVPRFLVSVFRNVMGGGIVSLLCLSFFAPLTEELVFRGLILRGFLGHYTPRKAVFASAILFACFHLNPYQFFSGLCWGLLLAWLFLETRSLLPCLFVHSLCNAQGWIVMELLPLDIPGYTDVLSTNAQFQPLWFDLLGCFLLGVGLILLAKIIRHGYRQK